MSIAYAPRGGYTADNFGTIAVGDETLDLHAALQEGDGVFVVDDDNTLLQVVLNEMPALEQVAAPTPFDDYPISQLRKEAHDRGLKATGSADDLRAAITEYDSKAADDEPVAADTDDDKDED